MGVIEFVILGAIALACVALFFALLKGKKQPKAKNEKPAEPKKESPKEEKPQELDRSFKIAKKERLSRVSKKALETNARTATIEKVFERTPPMPSQTDADVYVEKLDPASEELLKTLQNVDSSNRKVVSFKELKDQAKILSASDNNDIQEEYSSAKYISRSSAGAIQGNYTGVHLGRARPSKQSERLDIKEDVTEDDIVDFKTMFERARLERSGFMPMGRASSFNEQSQDIVDENIDFSDVVVADAIMNPKYKQKHQKHVRFKK